VTAATVAVVAKLQVKTSQEFNSQSAASAPNSVSVPVEATPRNLRRFDVSNINL